MVKQSSHNILRLVAYAIIVRSIIILTEPTTTAWNGMLCPRNVETAPEWIVGAAVGLLGTVHR